MAFSFPIPKTLSTQPERASDLVGRYSSSVSRDDELGACLEQSLCLPSIMYVSADTSCPTKMPHECRAVSLIQGLLD